MFTTNLLAKNRILVFSAVQPFLNLLYRSKVINSLTLRSTLKLTDIQALAADIPINHYYAATPEIEKFNDFYGIATILKQYSRIPADYIIRAHIEHAIGFNNFIFSGIMNCSYPTIITCADYREQVIKKAGLNKKIHKIGPYIYYAQPFLQTDEFKKERKRLGRNILVFPTHSTHWIQANYDIDGFCQKLRELKKQEKFDSIRISLFWKDINRAPAYQNHGFEVVTAGHMFDPLFLPRLRSLIELSDLTVSNIIGTQLGYSLCLNKPHFLISQTINRVDSKHELSQGFDAKQIKSTRNLTRLFEQYHAQITPAQRELANHYIGLNHLKSPQEINQMLTGE